MATVANSNQVLVVYSTKYGSTREVAEAVAGELRTASIPVYVQPAREVRTLEGYRAVVLGTALRIGHWYKDTDWQACRVNLDKEVAKTPWLKPVAVELFGGKYDPTKLRGLDKLLAWMPGTPLKGMPATDVRDFTAIKAWAGNLATLLQASAPQ